LLTLAAILAPSTTTVILAWTIPVACGVVGISKCANLRATHAPCLLTNVSMFVPASLLADLAMLLPVVDGAHRLGIAEHV